MRKVPHRGNRLAVIEAALRMDRARIWPDFRHEWIVHEDADIVVVDKPAGLSAQASDLGQPDDLVTRLKRYLIARGINDYIGVHQRLDRDTSGLVVFARRPKANASLAAQFAHRTIAKTYIACVTGWQRRGNATLRDWLAPRADGRVIVTQPGGSAKEAVTRVRVLHRRGNRVMLELSLETGRTHQARVQLAHAGSPIAGDALYGGAKAPRLMLHASKLSFDHPGREEPVVFESPIPPDLSFWVAEGSAGASVYDHEAALVCALQLAVERRWGLGRLAAATTTAFRLVNEDGDGLTRLAVDVYAKWLVAQFHGDDGPWADERRRDRVLDKLHAIGFDGIYLKIRPKRANLLVDSKRADFAPAVPVRGEPAPETVEIAEEGVPLLARLGDGLSTGIFLDQRSNRKRVREMAAGRRVANLFAYTCAFSVVAALGGAASTVSVDASVGALERGRSNFLLAGALDKGKNTFVADDVFRWMRRAARRGDSFDLVIVDPPSYSTTRQGRFVAEDDFAGLAAAAIRLLAPRGQLLACTNHRGISVARFRRMLFDGCRLAEREVAQLKDLPPPPDFPVAAETEANMKSALLTLKA